MAAVPLSQDPAATSQLVATCHCKRIQIQLPSKPTIFNECHCTVCYKYGALWAYYTRSDVTVNVAEDTKLEPYIREDSNGVISFNRCAHCGCMTHWWGTAKFAGPGNKMGINCRLVPESDVKDIDKRVSFK